MSVLVCMVLLKGNIALAHNILPNTVHSITQLSFDFKQDTRSYVDSSE